MLIHELPSYSSLIKEVYNPKTFILHAALLHQGCPHCGRFLTAASRRSLGRVSVPVWLIILSDQLWIVGLVGHYPTNNLIQRRLLPKRPKTLLLRDYAVLATLSGSYSSLWGRFLRVTQPSATRQHSHSFLDYYEAKTPSQENSENLFPFDLHVLGTPPAFILSQDQTLRYSFRGARPSIN